MCWFYGKVSSNIESTDLHMPPIAQPRRHLHRNGEEKDDCYLIKKERERKVVKFNLNSRKSITSKCYMRTFSNLYILCNVFYEREKKKKTNRTKRLENIPWTVRVKSATILATAKFHRYSLDYTRWGSSDYKGLVPRCEKTDDTTVITVAHRYTCSTLKT